MRRRRLSCVAFFLEGERSRASGVCSAGASESEELSCLNDSTLISKVYTVYRAFRCPVTAHQISVSLSLSLSLYTHTLTHTLVTYPRPGLRIVYIPVYVTSLSQQLRIRTRTVLHARKRTHMHAHSLSALVEDAYGQIPFTHVIRKERRLKQTHDTHIYTHTPLHTHTPTHTYAHTQTRTTLAPHIYT